MANQNTLSTENILAAIENSPEGFLDMGFNEMRTSNKSNNKYTDCYIVHDGKKKKAGLSWKMIPLTGGIKPIKDRKYDPTIQFRGSSGDLGKAVVAIYDKTKSLIDAGLKNGSIKVKGSKAIFRSIIQTELENGEQLGDPIIRFKLPFKNGKPEFRLVRIEENKDGTPHPVDIPCTEENIHNIIKSRMITSGYVNMDSVVFSDAGISIPAKVKLLIVKPVGNEAPEIESILSQKEMLEMSEGVAKPKEDEEEEEVLDENSPATENQLEELRQLAIGEQDENNDDE